MIQRAFEEIDREIQPRQTLLEAIGTHAPTVEAFLVRFRAAPLTQQAGQPLTQSIRERVHRVGTIGEARSVAADPATRVPYDRFLQTHLVDSLNLRDRVEAAYDLYTDHYYSTEEFPFSDRMLWAVEFDIDMLFEEVITRDHHASDFFRQHVEWYLVGRWPCGYTDDLIPIVF